jgi:hypothetical protein
MLDVLAARGYPSATAAPFIPHSLGIRAEPRQLSIVFLAAVPFATVVDAIIVLAAANVLLWVMIMYETRRYGALRYPLRHGIRSEPGAPIGADRRVPARREET